MPAFANQVYRKIVIELELPGSRGNIRSQGFNRRCARRSSCTCILLWWQPFCVKNSIAQTQNRWNKLRERLAYAERVVTQPAQPTLLASTRQILFSPAASC